MLKKQHLIISTNAATDSASQVPDVTQAPDDAAAIGFVGTDESMLSGGGDFEADSGGAPTPPAAVADPQIKDTAGRVVTWPAGTTITWCLATDLSLSGQPGGPFSAAIPATSPYAGLIQQACALWASVANVKFQMLTADSATADMRFGFRNLTGTTVGYTNFLDTGVTATTASFKPGETVAVDNPANNAVSARLPDGDYSFTGHAVANVFQDFVHEIGHAIGLDHNPSDTGAVMNAILTPANRSIDTNDVTSIQAVWGANPVFSSKVTLTDSGTDKHFVGKGGSVKPFTGLKVTDLGGLYESVSITVNGGGTLSDPTSGAVLKQSGNTYTESGLNLGATDYAQTILSRLIYTAPADGLATPATFSVAVDNSLSQEATNAAISVAQATKTSDLAFVFDTTGSMDPYIAAVQAGATSLLNAEFASGTDAHVAVVSFKDPQAGDPDQVVQTFTSDQAAVQKAINALTASGGGDIPEGDYSGLKLALDGSAGAWNLNPGTSRKIVLYTDAPVKDTELAATVNQYAHDLNTVIETHKLGATATGQTDTFTFAAQAGAAAPASVEIDTIQVGSDPLATASVKKIAADNGGRFLQAPTPAELIAAIITDINAPPIGGNFSITDTTTGAVSSDNGVTYSGPVAGLQWQYANITTDSLNITANVPNVFIHTGSGQDGVTVTSGNNIIDGYTNSNFLTGGSGNDIFYMDDRGPSSPIFSTIVNFHKGDDATVWGVTPTDFKLTILDNQGAVGYTGVDLIYSKTGQPDVSFVLAGYTSADITSGKLTISYARTADLPGLPGSQYMTIHANG